MSKIHIFIATVFLVYLSSMSFQTAFASRDDDGIKNHTEYRSSEGHDTEDEYEGKNHKKTTQLKNQEKLKKLQKKIQKIRASKPPLKTHTGTTTQIKTPIVPPTTKPINPPPTSTPPVQPAAVTKSSTVTYRTPEGSVPVFFSVTVKSGVITAAVSTTKTTDGTSAWYQDAFATKISSAVVGKKIAGLNLSAVGGASLTTRAFTQFIQSSF